MSTALLIELLLQVIAARTAAGWPMLKKLLDRFGNKIKSDAEQIPDALIGAAPTELKETLTQLLIKLRDGAKPGMKLVYTLLLSVLPQVADAIWDRLFDQKKVGAPSTAFPMLAMAGPPAIEDEVIKSSLTAEEIIDLLFPADHTGPTLVEIK